jgi:hypothetical protein
MKHILQGESSQSRRIADQMIEVMADFTVLLHWRYGSSDAQLFTLAKKEHT